MKFVGSEKLLAGSVFQNERGEKIEMHAQMFPGPAGGYDDIHLTVSNGLSGFIRVLTTDEARELYRVLGRVLPK